MFKSDVCDVSEAFGGGGVNCELNGLIYHARWRERWFKDLRLSMAFFN